MSGVEATQTAHENHTSLVAELTALLETLPDVPEIVLCDEPSSGLDPVMSATLDELIMDMHRKLGITFIVISHDTAEARTIADTMGMLAGGKLVAYGPKDELLGEGGHPALRQFFDRSTQGPISVL